MPKIVRFAIPERPHHIAQHGNGRWHVFLKILISDSIAIIVFKGFANQNKGEYVNPKISKKNIGLWKSYKNQDEINLTYSELKQYCYQG
jgi:hypothetical protein